MIWNSYHEVGGSQEHGSGHPGKTAMRNSDFIDHGGTISGMHKHGEYGDYRIGEHLCMNE